MSGYSVFSVNPHALYAPYLHNMYCRLIMSGRITHAMKLQKEQREKIIRSAPSVLDYWKRRMVCKAAGCSQYMVTVRSTQLIVDDILGFKS